MNTLGIIAEYNPFHNGHLYHLNEAKRQTGARHTVVVMSGNYTQRGEPAICDKWTRTQMALRHGADLVIELPVFFAAAASDYFARAAVALLHQSGIVDGLSFGSESGDIHAIAAAGQLLAQEPPAFKDALKAALGRGDSFAAARGEALSGLLPGAPEGLFSSPNDGLGIEYCKALCQLSSPITPHTVRRAPSCGRFLPAREIRAGLKEGRVHAPADALPGEACSELKEGRLPAPADALPAEVCAGLSALANAGEIADLDNFSDIFQYRLRTGGAAALRGAAGMTEGLEHRFMSLAARHRVLSELLSGVKTKRYTYTRLQRAALQVVLGITAEDTRVFDSLGGPQYLRVLGFRKESEFLLKEMCESASLPVVINLKHAPKILTEPALRMLNKEIETTDLYALATKKRIYSVQYEYTMPVVIV